MNEFRRKPSRNAIYAANNWRVCWISQRGAQGVEEREIPSIHTYIHIDYINLTIFAKVTTETNRNSLVSLKSSGSNAAAPVPHGGKHCSFAT